MVAVLLLVLVAVVVVTASSLTPWPFLSAVLLLASLAGIGTYLATGLGFASMAVAVLPAVLAFTVKSIAETLDEIGAARRTARPRRKPADSERPDSSKLAA